MYNPWRHERYLQPTPIYELDDPNEQREDALTRLRRRISADIQSGTLEFPPLPRVAIELGKLASASDPAIADAVELLEHAPELAAKVVRLASSAAYGRSRAADVHQAAMRLGVFGLRDLAFAASMGRVFRCATLDELVKEEVAHSFVVAVASGRATKTLGVGEQEGFMAGLFHDVGRLAVLMALAKYGRDNPKLLDHRLAVRLCDTLHGELGALLLDAWQIGGVVRAVAKHHHDPAGAGAAGPVCFAIATVDTADHFECPRNGERAERLREVPIGYQAGFSPDQLDDLATAIDEARADPLLAQILT